LVRRPVVISVVTDSDSTRDTRESNHLFGCAKLMWFFFIFFLSHFFFFLHMCILSLFIFRIIVCLYSLFWYFEWLLGGGFGYTLYSPFICTFCSLHEWGPIPGFELLRIRGDCVAMSQWMYFPSGHCENPS